MFCVSQSFYYFISVFHSRWENEDVNKNRAFSIFDAFGKMEQEVHIVSEKERFVFFFQFQTTERKLLPLKKNLVICLEYTVTVRCKEYHLIFTWDK